jgi:predicted nucleic acid-binding protein
MSIADGSEVTRSFFDTNILVYADDAAAGAKRLAAIAVIEERMRSGTAVVSTQVLQEYFVTATRKLGLSSEAARRKVELFATCDLVQVDLSIILGAIDLQRRHGLSLWDALIVRAAAVARCSVVLSEDMQHGMAIAGLRIENPLCNQ